jgi:predicted Zn finger-like uncharacterized protein
MLITCRSCQARYTVADDKVRGHSLTIRCRACEATILVDAHALRTPAPESAKTSVRPFAPEAPKSRPAPALQPETENSQMFTLAALVGRAKSSAPPPAADTPASVPTRLPSRKDGSGLIDLNALARAAEERARRVQSEPPPGAFAREARAVDEPPPPTTYKARFVGLAAAAAVLFAVGIFVVASGGDEATRAAGASPTKAADIYKSVARDAPTLLASTRVAEDDAAPVNKGAKRWRRGATASHGAKLAKVTSSGTSSSDAASAPPKPKPAADPCGCHGNLQCAIKCFK